MKANSIEEFFGTLLQSVTEAHKKHLMTGKYSSHKALNEFYDEMPELVDALIEHYQGTNGKVEKYENSLLATDMDTIKYLEELMDMCEDAKESFFDDEEALCSDIDDIIGQISSTLYQLRELTEHRSKHLLDYLNESLGVITESSFVLTDIKDYKFDFVATKNYDGKVFHLICIPNDKNAEIIAFRNFGWYTEGWSQGTGRSERGYYFTDIISGEASNGSGKPSQTTPTQYDLRYSVDSLKSYLETGKTWHKDTTKKLQDAQMTFPPKTKISDIKRSL